MEPQSNPPPPRAPVRLPLKVLLFLYFALMLVGLGFAADFIVKARQRDGWDMRPTGLVPTTPAPAPPSMEAPPSQGDPPKGAPLLGTRLESASDTPPQERRYSYDPFILIIAFIGAGGGCLHGLTSLAYHSGWNRGPDQGWVPFYCALPFIGAGMAIAIYLILRGGLGGFEVSAEGDPEFTYAAWAALGGLFSPSTLTKLQELFNAVFQPGKLRPSEKP